MYMLLLAVIYLAFISLGLPDSLLGSGWPVMSGDIGAPLSFAGIVTMIISGGTIVSSLFSYKLTIKLGTGLLTALSVLLTAAALFGFSVSGSFAELCLWAIPYGLGAGAIDAALNNYVAVNYSSRHMSWLHSFWGVGTIMSPYIMSYALTTAAGWSGGYRAVSLIQLAIAVIMFLSLPMWKRTSETAEKTESRNKTLKDVLKIKGVIFVLAAFFAYCAAESTVMLWSSSYLVEARGVGTELAAAFASLFFIGITAGRFLTGIIANRFGDFKLIMTGASIMTAGIILITLPFEITSLIGFVVIGLGCAPVYPSIIHSTPFNFGAENSQAIIGIQMASAYVGSTFMPPLFGLIAEHIEIRLMPLFLIFFTALLVIMIGRLKKCVKR